MLTISGYIQNSIVLYYFNLPFFDINNQLKDKSNMYCDL